MDVLGGHSVMDPVTGALKVEWNDHKAVEVRRDKSSKFLVKCVINWLTRHQFQYIGYIVMAIAFGVIKLSVLLLYRRIFIGSLFHVWSLTICGLIIMWSLSFTLGFGFECGTDASHLWRSTKDSTSHCIDTTSISMAFAVSDLITDLLILAIPIPFVLRLQKSLGERLQICGIFLLGLL